jgi:hypothetical protein
LRYLVAEEVAVIFWLRWLGLRRQVYALTERDFRRYPLWEHALDEEGLFGQDEATVRPVRLPYVPRNRGGIYVCAARAHLADGRELPGYLGFCVPEDLQLPIHQDGHDLSSPQPHLLVGERQFGFWFGCVAPSYDEVAALYQALGSSPDALFPIRVEASLLVEGEAVRRTVMIRGFQYRSGTKIIELR